MRFRVFLSLLVAAILLAGVVIYHQLGVLMVAAKPALNTGDKK